MILRENKPQNNYVANSLEVTIKVGLVIGLLVWCFMILKPFLMITLWGIIIAVAVHPIFSWTRTKLGNRTKLAAILVTLGMLILIISPMVLLAESLVGGIMYIKEIINSRDALILPPPPSVKDWPVIGGPLHDFWTDASQNMAALAVKYQSQIIDGLSWFVKHVTAAGLGVLMFMASIILAGIILIFSDQGDAFARKTAVRLTGERGEMVLDLIDSTIRNVFKGILGVAFIQAVLAGIGFLIAGVPGAGLWTLIAFFLAIIQIGLAPVIIPVLIWVFFQESTGTFIFLLIWCAPILLLDNILKPIMLGQGAKVPMAVVFVGAIGGFISFGIIGLFVGAVVLSLGYKLMLHWIG